MKIYSNEKYIAHDNKGVVLFWFLSFGFFVLMAYHIFLGYLMPKPFS